MYTQHLARPPSLLVAIRGGAAMQWPIPGTSYIGRWLLFCYSFTQFGYYLMNSYDVLLHSAHGEIVFFFSFCFDLCRAVRCDPFGQLKCVEKWKRKVQQKHSCEHNKPHALGMALGMATFEIHRLHRKDDHFTLHSIFETDKKTCKQNGVRLAATQKSKETTAIQWTRASNFKNYICLFCCQTADA